MENEEVLQETENPVEEQPTSEVETEDLAEKLSKAEEIAKNQRIRAEKAEQELKKFKKPEAKVETVAPKNDDLSWKDVRALQDVPDEDIDAVVEAAKVLKLSIPEAKKHAVVQTLLKTRAEERQTANVANTNVKRRSNKPDSPTEIIQKFEKGELSSSDEDVEALVKAQLAAQNPKRNP